MQREVPAGSARQTAGGRPAAVATEQIDNERVTVTEWRFPPGSETGWHVHPHGLRCSPMSTGVLVMHTHEGASANHLTAGASYARKAANEHNVINESDDAFVFVEIELK